MGRIETPFGFEGDVIGRIRLANLDLATSTTLTCSSYPLASCGHFYFSLTIERIEIMHLRLDWVNALEPYREHGPNRARVQYRKMAFLG